ncbi:hypothetical protein [Micromonospora sp. HM5-17]|uniref:hypothetical protein n=1 Tax=Micromonospora sp. HM5-17 TaxID=2487710 RepID=UPI000F46D9B8|nr:hypothetical protein [Micromonospora sp. HM5-17]ROT32866.1 hypothetical protein EF879_06715 [Micromonospora sp. HM5-17]
MRRILSTVLVGCGVLGLGFSLVGVDLGVDAVAAYAEPGKKVCTITDERMSELSGLIATSDGYIVINDGSEDPSRERVFLLDERCRLDTAVTYGGNGPLDPEDLAISPDGKTVWIADTGDNGTERRPTVALWSMPVSGSSRPVIHRLAYPDEQRRDAEALLIGDDGVPLIITKTTGKAEIYRPAEELKKNNTVGVPLEKAGEFSLPKSTTANRFGPAGRLTITGAARSPDGKRIVVRTYADAFEWDVQDGDLVKTLTTGTPRMTPLEDPFGEAIAYSADGKSFLTVSDVASLDEPTDVTILSYTPATAAAAADDESEKDAEDSGGSWTDSLTLDDITYLIGGVGVLGALLVALGVFGIVRARRRPDDGTGAGGGDDDDLGPRAGRQARPGGSAPTGRQPGHDDRDGGWSQDSGGRGYGQGYRSDRPADDLEPVGRRRSAGGGGVYGGRPAGGGVYGGGQGGPERGVPPAGRPRPDGAPVARPRSGGGGVYGGRPAGGGVYGGGQGGPERGVPPAGRPRPDGAPVARPRSGGGGVYGGQPGGGGVYGRGAQPARRGGRPGPDEQPWTGSGHDDPAPRAGQYGQPGPRSGGPDNYDYR